ncbi:hypothetical protein I79_012238 [Cricetulus griseus]|uniref:Uncharacterized protein n=1 Tax=Cricetulus griseus TaxID=10029 RepID=G3HNA1_CRIGR|nr:hypothetical protein I79_012238 [Cricetulus griseus]
MLDLNITLGDRELGKQGRLQKTTGEREGKQRRVIWMDVSYFGLSIKNFTA